MMFDSRQAWAGHTRRMIRACALTALLAAAVAPAATVELRIQAGNPIEKPQMTSVRANLPALVRTNDIINLDGLELGYDVKTDTFFVHKEILLGPKELEVFKVELRDIWVIPEETLKELTDHTATLAEKLTKTNESGLGLAIKDQVNESVAAIRELQEKNKIRTGDDAVRHIRAYETNARELELVRKYVGRLENLVLSTGQDTGKLIGGYKTSAKPRRDVEMSKEDYKTAVFRITVRNTSPDEARKINVRHELPPEIRPDDVIDTGELELESDVKTGQCFVTKKEVALEPGQSVTYEVKIRDKWNVNQYRFGALKAYAEDVLGRVSARHKYSSVEERLKEIIVELDGIQKQKAPQVLDDKYVAFFRDQSDRLDLIEQKINRIESALRPMKKPPEWGFPIKPPSPKTTWLIIYIVLGFLFLMSLLFFLRWYGGSGSGTSGS